MVARNFTWMALQTTQEFNSRPVQWVYSQQWCVGACSGRGIVNEAWWVFTLLLCSRHTLTPPFTHSAQVAGASPISLSLAKPTFPQHYLMRLSHPIVSFSFDSDAVKKGHNLWLTCPDSASSPCAVNVCPCLNCGSKHLYCWKYLCSIWHYFIALTWNVDLKKEESV
jgi:hypothetical protein